jgi:hypothetical protein
MWRRRWKMAYAYRLANTFPWNRGNSRVDGNWRDWTEWTATSRRLPERV